MGGNGSERERGPERSNVVDAGGKVKEDFPYGDRRPRNNYGLITGTLPATERKPRPFAGEKVRVEAIGLEGRGSKNT